MSFTPPVSISLPFPATQFNYSLHVGRTQIRLHGKFRVTSPPPPPCKCRVLKRRCNSWVCHILDKYIWAWARGVYWSHPADTFPLTQCLLWKRLHTTLALATGIVLLTLSFTASWAGARAATSMTSWTATPRHTTATVSRGGRFAWRTRRPPAKWPPACWSTRSASWELYRPSASFHS